MSQAVHPTTTLKHHLVGPYTQMSKKMGCGFSSCAAFMYTVSSFLTMPWELWTWPNTCTCFFMFFSRRANVCVFC